MTGPAPACRPGEAACGFFLVPVEHPTRGVRISAAGSAEGLVVAADALLYEAFKRLPLDRDGRGGTPMHELHDRARDALRGMLAALAS